MIFAAVSMAEALALDGPSAGEESSASPGWHAETRQALDAWQHAGTSDEKLSLLETLATLSIQHPLALAALKPDLETGEARVRARVLQVLSDAGFAEVADAARRAVLDPDSTLAAAAASVLGRWAPPGVRDNLIAVWKQPHTPDPATAEAVTSALSRSVRASDLAALKDSESANIRQAALAALRRQGARECAVFLDDADPAVADAAAAAIYDDRLEVAWAALVIAGCRNESSLTAAGRSRAVAAAWSTGGSDGAEQLAHWLAGRALPIAGARPDPVALDAFHALLQWDGPPEQDPVVPDRPFRARPRPAAQAWSALQHQSSALAAWASALGADESAAWKSWQTRRAQAPPSPQEFADFLTDTARPEGERLYHFRDRMNASSDSAPFADLAAAALAATEAPVLRSAARAWLFRQHGPAAIPWLLQSLTNATASEKQAAIRLLDQHPSAEAQTYLLRLLDQARFGLVDPAVVPEVVEAVERRARAEGTETRGLRAALDAWRATQAPSLGDPLRPWRPALQPGDAEAGRAVFLSSAAHCTSCHQSAPAETVAGTSAPPLDGIGARLDGPALLEAVVLPADPVTRRSQPTPADGGCRPMGTVLTLRELRDLLSYLRSRP